MADTICLITAAVATDFEDPAEALSGQVLALAREPKVGILALAAVLERARWQSRIFDLDDAYVHYLAGHHRGLKEFPDWVAPQIVATGARLFGFSSLCSSYPLTIRIAEAVKRQSPNGTIVLGGPQASATDLASLSAFPFIDFILRGEADLSLPLFLEEWSKEGRWSEIPGLTWRSRFGPQRNPDAPVIDNLDDLPLPAYHLSGNLKDAAFGSLELGRGCPFSCTFCSTNDFFRRKFRVKSPERMLADMRSVASRYGLRSFNLVHDMFTIDRRKVTAFCDAMIESGEGFNWSCSARTDCVDENLLELMARAGCDSIFFGVETGSRRMQRIIDKDLDPAESRRAVEIAERLDIHVTVSTIVGFPEETEEDLRETLDVFMHAMRHPRSTPQINILAPLSGTPIFSKYKDQMVLEDVSSQLSYPGRSQCDSDRTLVVNYPSIFPNFYLLPTACLDRSSLQELTEFLPMAHRRLRWLLIAIYQRTSDILDFFRAWRRRRIALHPDMSGNSLRQYYTADTSVHELVEFLREYVPVFGDAAVEALLTYEEVLARAIANAPARPAGPSVSGRMASTDIPIRRPDVHVIELDCDIQNVVDSLKRVAPLSAVRTHKYYRTENCPEDEIRLIKITPLIAHALSLCGGLHTVTEFESRAGLLFDCPKSLRGFAARRLLKRLRDDGMIEICRSESADAYARTTKAGSQAAFSGSSSGDRGARSANRHSHPT